MDTGAKLDHMANQIAAFFRSYPEEEAIAGVHEHIVAFWSPRMRTDLLVRASVGPERLDPLVVKALQSMGSGASPAKKETAGPAEVGAIGASDAG